MSKLSIKKLSLSMGLLGVVIAGSAFARPPIAVQECLENGGRISVTYEERIGPGPSGNSLWFAVYTCVGGEFFP